MLWILLMFAGMGLFMLGIIFGEAIDLWYCRTKYDRDDSYKVIEERENTARKLNREKQKLEKEVHKLNRQIEDNKKAWGFEKSGLEDLLAKYKSSSASWHDEWKKKDVQVWQILDILAPNYRELSEKDFFEKHGPNLSKEVEPVESKGEWFSFEDKLPEYGQQIELRNPGKEEAWWITRYWGNPQMINGSFCVDLDKDPDFASTYWASRHVEEWRAV